MSFLATLIVGWAGIHTWVALHHGLMFLKRRASREYLYFALLSVAFAVHAVGAALLADATTVAEGTFARQVGFVGGALAAGALVSFAAELTEPRPRLVRATWVWAGLGLAANLAGLFFVAADPAVPRVPLYEAAPVYFEPRPLVPGIVWALGCCVAATLALVPLVRVARRDRTMRLIVGAMAFAVFGGMYDVVTAVAALGSHRLSEHSTVLLSLLLSHVMVRRLSDTDDELDRRTRERSARHEELSGIQAELVRTEQLATVGKLSAVIAHEVRSPLSVLKDAIGELRSKPIDGAYRGTLLDVLDEETDRLNRLVHDLLTSARPAPAIGDTIDVAALIRGAVDHCGDERIEVKLELDGGPATISGDPEQLSRAVTHVIANACAAMPEGGHLSVRSSTSDLDGQPALAIIVEVGTHELETGLGLAVAERVVTAHAGELTIADIDGTGARLTLLLPVATQGESKKTGLDQAISPSD